MNKKIPKRNIILKYKIKPTSDEDCRAYENISKTKTMIYIFK